MHVVISRHPSLEDMKYINDISSVLVIPPLCRETSEEHIYQELNRVNQSVQVTPPDLRMEIDENKENRPPLMPIKCPISRIPVWTPPNQPKGTCGLSTRAMTEQKKKPTEILTMNKMTPKSKPGLHGKGSFG